jgi:hypothetical protein
MAQTSHRRRKAVGPARPTYLKAEDTDKVMAIVLALMSEVASLRDRVDTHERLAQLGVLPTPGAVDDFRPDPDLLNDRETRREAYVRRLLRVVLEDMEPDRRSDPSPLPPETL